MSVTDSDGQRHFCANTIAQLHPTTGKLVWLHRTSAKYYDAAGMLERIESSII